MQKEIDQVIPVHISDEESSRWTEDRSFFFRLALTLNRSMPRGKAFFPRWLGRLFGKNDKLAVRTASGALLAVDPENWDIFTKLWLMGGTWDKPVLEACIACLQPGDVFYDLGANVGYMSIEAASLFKDKIRIYAFEPQPNLAHIAALSARLNHFQN